MVFGKVKNRKNLKENVTALTKKTTSVEEKKKQFKINIV